MTKKKKPIHFRKLRRRVGTLHAQHARVEYNYSQRTHIVKGVELEFPDDRDVQYFFNTIGEVCNITLDVEPPKPSPELDEGYVSKLHRKAVLEAEKAQGALPNGETRLAVTISHTVGQHDTPWISVKALYTANGRQVVVLNDRRLSTPDEIGKAFEGLKSTVVDYLNDEEFAAEWNREVAYTPLGGGGVRVTRDIYLEVMARVNRRRENRTITLRDLTRDDVHKVLSLAEDIGITADIQGRL